MQKSKLTTGALRQTLLKAIDDVATGDLSEQKAGAIAKLAAQVNNSLLAEVEIMRSEIIGKLDGRSLGVLNIGDDDVRMIEHEQKPPQPSSEPMRRSMPVNSPRIIDRRPQPGASHDFGDPLRGAQLLIKPAQANA